MVAEYEALKAREREQEDREFQTGPQNQPVLPNYMESTANQAFDNAAINPRVVSNPLAPSQLPSHKSGHA